MSGNELAAAVVHEVRRILAPARARAEIAMRTTGLPPEVCESLTAIVAASKACDDLMNHMLHLGKPGGAARLGEVIAGFRSEARIATDLEIDCYVGLPKVALDAVISNLVTNAKRAANRPVLIRTSLSSTGNQPLAVIEVQDDGPGMTESELSTAMSPFVSYSGSTGLGLPICRAIVESVGGAIHVTSKRGGGTIVRLTVPVTCSMPVKKAA